MTTLRTLTLDSMIDLSAAWLDPRRALASLPFVAPVLPEVASAHAALVSARDASEARDRRRARAIHDLLRALAQLADDEADATRLESIRARLFARGPEHAGAITEPMRATLAAIPLEGGSVLDALSSLQKNDDATLPARREWIRAVHALIVRLELEERLDPTTRAGLISIPASEFTGRAS